MFPLLYHTHHSLHNDDLRFWLELASHSAGPMLELGCGTGRVLVPLLRAGHAVVGIDHDCEMLALLRASLPPDMLPSLQVFQADFCAFHLQRKFSLILLPCNTYSTLDADQRLQLLRCIQMHLLPGGLFAASLPNPRLLKSLSPHAEAELEEIFDHPLDGEPVQVYSAWEKTAQTLRLRWHYDHLLPDGGVERTSETITHYLTPAEEYLYEIRAAGFSSTKTLGDFDGTPYSADAPQLILLVSR